MKTLLLMRHAKALPAYGDTCDFARSLAERGQREASVTAGRLKEREIFLDLLLASPAKRAAETAAVVSAELGRGEDDVLCDPDLYLADSEALLETVRGFDDSWQTVLLVGHNPGISEFAQVVCAAEIEHLSTAGLLEIEFDLKQWREVGAGSGSLVYATHPETDK